MDFFFFCFHHQRHRCRIGTIYYKMHGYNKKERYKVVKRGGKEQKGKRWDFEGC